MGKYVNITPGAVLGGPRAIASDGTTYQLDSAEKAPRLPVILVHGMHARDFTLETSPLWGRIPERLREGGTEVFFGCQDAWGDVERNSLQLYHTVHEVLERTGAAKVHMIAHSKGGLDIRHCVHVRDLGDHTASIVTLGTPYHGLRLCDRLLALGPLLKYIAAPVINANARRMGDEQPDALGLLHSVSTAEAERLIEENPDLPGIEYRSYGFVPRPGKYFYSHNARSLLIRAFDGDNDGIVPLTSTEATNWVVVRAEQGAKMGHDDSYDLNQKDIELTMPDGAIYANAPDFIEAVVNDLDRIAQRRALAESQSRSA